MISRPAIVQDRALAAARVLDTGFTNVLAATAFAYTATFNVLDDGLRTAIAGLFGILVILRCVLSWSSPAARFATFIFLGFLFVLLFQFVFLQEQGDTALHLSLVIRLMTCLAAFMVFVFGPRSASPALLKTLCLTTLLIAVAAAATGQGAVLGAIPRPAAFTGGAEGVHATGYALTAVCLGTVTLWRCGWLATRGMVLIGGPVFVLIALFQVRTTWIMCLAYALVAIIPYLTERQSRGLWPALVCLAVAAAMAFSVIERDVDLTELSSGRTAAYTERIGMVLNRPAGEMLLGTGPGSEVQTSSIWWWSAKNSHNDFLDITIQSGLIGLTCLVALLLLAATVLDRIQLPLFAAFCVSSLISNGLIGRPFLAMMLLAFLCVPLKPSSSPAVVLGRLSRLRK